MPRGTDPVLIAEDRSEPIARGRRIHRDLKVACAIVYGIGAGMSKLDLLERVLEDGLPSRAEREAVKAERMQEETPRPERGDNATP